MYQIDFFPENFHFSTPVAFFFLALSSAGHAGDLRVHHGASAHPGRAPWRVFWVLKSRESGK